MRSIARRQYTGRVTFGPWYPLAEAGEHAPASEGILQLRVVSGLVDYPRGKSAMVWYEHAPDVRAAALALASAHRGKDLLCRHVIELDPATDFATLYAKVTSEFVRRFGTLPLFHTADPTRCISSKPKP
jgi:hypothetical protein